MKKAILAIAAAATIAVGTLSVPTTADSRSRGVLPLAIFGGVVAGTVLGAAIVGHPGYYAYDYDGPRPVRCDGYWARQRMYDGYGNFVSWGRPQYFCR